MNTLKTEIRIAPIQDVKISEDTLTVDLKDGRTLSVPISWYPRLAHGSMEERNHWRLIGDGEGIHWMELDEDISVESILAGKPSDESQSSLSQWLTLRQG